MRKERRTLIGSQSTSFGAKLALVLVLVSFAGCATPSRTELCIGTLPVIEGGVQDALLALSPWTDQETSGRAIASAKSEVPLLVAADRKYWREWAEVRLFEIQRSMDFTESERRGALRNCLSILANEFVIFHGYASQGRADRMEASLRKISTLASQSRKAGCP